jgi:hypothetical protein
MPGVGFGKKVNIMSDILTLAFRAPIKKAKSPLEATRLSSHPRRDPWLSVPASRRVWLYPYVNNAIIIPLGGVAAPKIIQQ